MSYETPSTENCLIGSKLAFKNSKRHILSAEVLAKNDIYGQAQSHLVLGGEEAIKAIFLQFRGLGLLVSQEDLKDILSQHTPRHKWALVFLLMTFLIGDESENQFLNIFKHTSINNGKIPQADDFLIFLGKESIRVLEDKNYKNEFNPIMDWWLRAEMFKQKGFYLDYNNQKWSTPDKISQKDYDNSYEQVSKIISMTRNILDVFSELSNDEVKEFRQLLKPLLNSWKQLENDDRLKDV